MLAAYLGESGHSGDSRIVAMGGFLGNAIDWEELGKRWRELMRHHGNGKDLVFHMSHLESLIGEFVGWDEARKRALLSDVFTLLQDFFLIAIGGVVVVEHYDVLPDIAQRAFGDPWFLCMQMCLGEIGSVQMLSKQGGLNDSVAVFCDRQMEFSGRGTDCFNYIAAHSSFGKRLGSITFASKDILVQLQTADLVAYEVKKYTLFDGIGDRPPKVLRYQLVNSIWPKAKAPGGD